MPLIKRAVEPVELSRAHVGQGIRNELECVTNNTLSNVIRQLSSLSKHAEDMFAELFHEANQVFHRANNLQDRVDKLKVKVTQLDSTQDVVSLQDINMRKPFKSSVIREQQIISKRSRPQAIQETYVNCDAPPALSKLNAYREDGKDSMKFYTDATYFFELWCQQMQKDTEKQQKKIKHKRPKQTAKKTPVKQIVSKQWNDKSMGVEFEKTTSHSRDISQDHYEYRINRPNSLEVPGHGEYVKPNQQMTGSGDTQRTSMMAQQLAYRNGPVNKVSNMEQNDRGLYQHQQQQYQQYDNSNTGSPYGNQNRDSHLQNMTSPLTRPVSRPPPPPFEMGSRTTSRESLPPPPPPPPMEIINAQYVSSPDDNYVQNHHIRRSPAKSIDSHDSHHSSHSHGSGIMSLESTPNSICSDLPPPPPSPPNSGDPGTPSSMSSIPPPPPPPPPPAMGGLHQTRPPPLPPGPPPPDHDLHSSNMNGSIDNSPTMVSSAGSQGSQQKEEVQDARSDLLDAIRTGINLRKVQQQDEKRDRQRRNTAGHLDVQAIMEAAFEMRRQAMERDSDEEGEEEEDDDNEWSDGS